MTDRRFAIPLTRYQLRLITHTVGVHGGSCGDYRADEIEAVCVLLEEMEAALGPVAPQTPLLSADAAQSIPGCGTGVW